MAHIMLATSAEPAVRNTDPSWRTLHGRMHHFAHNRGLNGVKERLSGEDVSAEVIGNAASELAFLDLLDGCLRWLP